MIYSGDRYIMLVRVIFLPIICLSERRYLDPADMRTPERRFGRTATRINFHKQTEISEKGKPRESAGRKATGPKALGSSPLRWQPGRQYFGYSFK